MFEKFTSAVAAFLAGSNSEQHLQSSISDAPVPNYEYPGDYCCTIFDNYDWKTDLSYVTMCADASQETSSFVLGDYGMDDKNSSWACGKNVWADFCSERGCNPMYGKYRQGTAGNTRNNKSGHNDWFSEVHLHPYDPDVLGAITTFGYQDCREETEVFFAHEDPTLKAEYTQADLWDMGAYNDQIESVMVPFGISVEFYDNDGWGGDSEVVRGSAYVDGQQQMTCVNLGNLRSRVTSLKVYKDYVLGPAAGYWESITHSGTIDFVYHVGVDYSHSTLDSSTQEYAINYSMEAGISFMGNTEKETISAGFTETIKNDTQETYGYDISQDVTISCDQGGDDGRVGLWQWVTATNDEVTPLFSKHTICRYGDNWTTQPACPWNACLDSQCTTCVEGWQA